MLCVEKLKSRKIKIVFMFFFNMPICPGIVSSLHITVNSDRTYLCARLTMHLSKEVDYLLFLESRIADLARADIGCQFLDNKRHRGTKRNKPIRD